jgi:hypothetical protein
MEVILSKLRFLAKFIVKFDFLVRLFRSIYIQVSLYAPSANVNYFFQEYLAEQNNLTEYKNSVEQQNQILENLRLLRARFIDDNYLVRVGPKSEGGYVIYNNVIEIDTVISIGVAKDTSFEEHFNSLASGNPNFYLFDHTDQPLRKLPKNFCFYSKGLGPSTNEVENLFKLSDIIELCINVNSKNILKIDIDGSEYSCLSVCSSEEYKKFDQIIFEFHNLADWAISSKALNKILNDISKDFFVIHLHPNNFEPWKVLNGFAIPNVLEVTFLNKRYEKLIENKVRVFPTELDFPNNAKGEMFLGSFIY